jgi:hypothetical protein
LTVRILHRLGGSGGGVFADLWLPVRDVLICGAY